MALDLSTLGNSGTGENLPEVLHAVADMMKVKGRLAKVGIGGSPLGYDPKQHFAETLQHLGIGADPAAPATAVPTAASPGTAPAPAMPVGAMGADASDVNMDHLQEVIQHLRSMGGGGQGQTPFNPASGAPATTAGAESIAGVGQVVPPGSFTQGPDGSQVELNPQGAGEVIQPPATADPNAGVTNLKDLKFNFKIDPNGPKPPPMVPDAFTGEYQEMDRRAKSKQADLDKLIAGAPAKIHGVYYYTDPKTGQEMMYEPPKPVELQKEIGGKKHSFTDWASLGLALVAAAVGGQNGQAFAAGMLQGWFGGKAKLAERDTAQNDREFANAQQARVSDAESYMKMIGFKSDEITHLFAHMDRTMNMQLRADEQKNRLDETKARNDDIARRDAFTAVNASKGRYQTALKGMNVEDAKVQAAGWRAAETGLPADQRTAPTDAQVEASINSARSSFRDRQGASLQKGYLGLAQSAPDAKTAAEQIKMALRYMDPKSDEYADWSKMAKELESGAHPWPKEQNFALKVARAHLSTANMELMALGQRAARGTWTEQDDADWARAQFEQQKALDDIDAIAQGGGGSSGTAAEPPTTKPWKPGDPVPEGSLPEGEIGGDGKRMHPPKPSPSKEQQAKIEADKQLKVDAVKKVRELTLHADTYGMTRRDYDREVAKVKAQAEGDSANLIRKKDGTVDSAASEKAVAAAVSKATKALDDQLKSEYDRKLKYFKSEAGLGKDEGKPKAEQPSSTKSGVVSAAAAGAAAGAVAGSGVALPKTKDASTRSRPPLKAKAGDTWKSPSGSTYRYGDGPKGQGWYKK